MRETMSIDALRPVLGHRQGVLRLQPLYDFTTGKPVQHEVLLRLLDGVGNETPPHQFLGTVVKYNLLPTVDKLTLHLIESQLSIARRGLATPVALNISSRSLGNLPYIEHLAGPPWRELLPQVVFELKAGDMHRASEHFDILNMLLKLGITASLNYQGGGAAQAQRAAQLGFRYLKFDTRAFCLTDSDEDRDQSIQAIRAARNEGVSVVFERVETEADLETLKSYRPDLVQGYLFGWPQFGFTTARHALMTPPMAL